MKSTIEFPMQFKTSKSDMHKPLKRNNFLNILMTPFGSLTRLKGSHYKFCAVVNALDE